MSENNQDYSARIAAWKAAQPVIIFVTFVVVLTAILYPIFTKAREHVRGPSCQNYLKECAVALQLYCNDYDGMMPSSVLVHHSNKWSKRDFETFATKNGIQPYYEVKHRVTWPQLLYDNMKNKDVMWCCGDSPDQANPDAQVSYWYKTALDKAWFGEGCTRPYRKLADYANASHIISFYEHASFHFPKKRGWLIKHDYIPPLGNNAKINVAHLDTHVTTLNLKNATSGDPVNCAANRDGEPMYFNYDTKAKKRLPDGVAAKYVDPGRYCDSF